MELIRDLAAISGVENVLSESEQIKPYLSDLSLVPEGSAQAVVYPGSTEEVSRIVKYCGANRLPVVPVSSAVHLYGSAVPKQGGVIVDLRRMNQIHEIDLVNRCVRFDAGVTWKQLTEALAEKRMRVIMPLAPWSNRSVATDHLEREVTTNMVYDYGEPMQSVEVVFPNGDVFRTGSASVNGYPNTPARGANPAGPGLDFYRLLQNAQGTFGIVTWMSLKIQSIPKIDKVYFAPLDSIDYGMDFLYRILPRRIGQECVILNRRDMAELLAESPEEYESNLGIVPEWTLVLVVSGLIRRPEEKIAYEDHFLQEVIQSEFPDIRLSTGLKGIRGADRKMLRVLREPWPEQSVYWKYYGNSGCQDLFFMTKPEKASYFVDTVRAFLENSGFDCSNLGIYLQPIEHNRACQVQFSFHYNRFDAEERRRIDELSFQAAKLCRERGGYFTRPYGRLAGYLYDQAAGYRSALKRVKSIFDPENIMNPGNLCF